MLNNLVPPFILEQFHNGRFSGQFTAVSLFIDIAGFTAMSEQLMQHGKAGAELLADTMTAVFDPLLAAVFGCDGIVTGFAGDSFTALFPLVDDDPAVYQQALAAAHSIQQQFRDQPIRQTPLGSFPFAVKIGLADGAVEWGILKGEGERPLHTYYFRGTAVTACIHAQQQAAPGDLILSPNAAARLVPVIATEPAPAGHCRLTGVSAPLPPIRSVTLREIAPEQLLPFFAPELLYRPAQGEFRPVVTAFLGMTGVPTAAHLEQLIRLVFPLVRQYGGTLSRLDFGDKGCNLLLFWGTPVSHENNVARVLDCLLDLRQAFDRQWETADVPRFRAGVTYHRMYAGRVGGTWQSEHSCYGRGVSLAARLMVKAEWDEVCLDEAVQMEASAAFHIAKIGDWSLKGFEEPQPAYTLLNRRQSAAAFIYEGELVGRQAEMARLQDFLRPLLTNHFAGLFVVYGEPGIGKTRLLYELQQQTADQARWLFCPCDELLRQLLNPFKECLASFFNQSPVAAPSANQQAFTA